MIKTFTFFCLITFGFLNFGQIAEFGQNGAKAESYIIVEMKHGAVLGGVENGKFIKAETAAKKLKRGEKLIVYGLDGKNNKDTAKIEKIRADYDVCPEYSEVETEKKPASGISFSSGADHNAVPRVPQKLDSDGKVYTKIVADFLKTKKISNPVVKIEQLYRVDLEGDGKDEVVIRATNYKNFGASETKGDYSFVLVRKIVGKTVKNILLTGDFTTKDVEFSALNTHEVLAIADLNGDGKMEIIIYGQYYEGHWDEAYQIVGEKVVKVLETGCGV